MANIQSMRRPLVTRLVRKEEAKENKILRTGYK